MSKTGKKVVFKAKKNAPSSKDQLATINQGEETSTNMPSVKEEAEAVTMPINSKEKEQLEIEEAIEVTDEMPKNKKLLAKLDVAVANRIQKKEQVTEVEEEEVETKIVAISPEQATTNKQIAGENGATKAIKSTFPPSTDEVNKATPLPTTDLPPTAISKATQQLTTDNRQPTTDNGQGITIAQLKKWLAEGNKDAVFDHIKSGQLTVLPVERGMELVNKIKDQKVLIEKQKATIKQQQEVVKQWQAAHGRQKEALAKWKPIGQEHAAIFDAARRLFYAFHPITGYSREISEYIDIDHPYKLNMGKLMDEFMDFAKSQANGYLGRKNQEPKGIQAIIGNIQKNTNTQVLEDIDLTTLIASCSNNELDILPWMEFVKKLGFFKEAAAEVNTNPSSTENKA